MLALENPAGGFKCNIIGSWCVFVKLKEVTTHHRGEGHLEAVDPRQAEVRQFDLSSAGDQDVLGLQVSVDHAV